MNPLSTFGAGMFVGAIIEIAWVLLIPRWKPGDYTRLFDVGVACGVVGGVLMLVGFILFGA